MSDPSVPPAPPSPGAESPAPLPPAPPAGALLEDEPAPPVKPIVLRGGRPSRHRALQTPAAGQSGHDSLVDAITANVLAGLAGAVRRSVHRAVLELAPRMAVSLPEKPAPPRESRAEARAEARPGPELARRSHDG